jgi:hypothetical protein
LVIALRPQTPKLIRGGWSHCTDTSEPVPARAKLGVKWGSEGVRLKSGEAERGWWTMLYKILINGTDLE